MRSSTFCVTPRSIDQAGPQGASNLREILLTITARDDGGEIRWSRQFRDRVFINSLTTGEFHIQVTGARSAKLSWTIDQVRGKRS